MDVSKAAGIDNIPTLVLKELSDVLAYPLSRIFQASMKKGVFPQQWKTALVVPVFKKGDKTNPSNYRPVALLPVMSKIMEKYVNYHLIRHLSDQKLLVDSQFGFRPGCHTLHPLLLLHQWAADALDTSQELSAVALDIAGAFDTVWHRRLLMKCESMGVDSITLKWLESYLSGRKQVVKIDGILTSCEEVKAGVPQGSILGPTLFLLFINDVPEAITNRALIYADDCTIVQGVPKPSARNQCRRQLQQDIDNLVDWAEVNKMQFAAHKTQLMTLSRRRDRNTVRLEPLVMNGVELEEVNNMKLLGVDIDNEGSAKLHVKQKAATAAKLVGMLRRQSQYLSESARYHVFVSCIRPLLEYCCPLFNNIPIGALQLLDNVQRRAANLFPSMSNLLDSLELRREVAGLSQMYRIVNGSAPQMLLDSLRVEPLRATRLTRQSESSMGSLQPPRSRTTHHQMSFLPFYIRRWNVLPDDVTLCNGLADFKRRVAHHLRTKSKIS